MSAEINEIRELFLNHLNKSPDHFHPDDVERVKRCDWIIKRFLEYQKIVNHKTDVNVTAKKLIEAMKWRKEQGVNQLKESDFPMEYFQCGGLFLYGKDKAGARLMIFRVKINKKIEEWRDNVKKYIIYLFERVDREQDENKLTLLFDCTDGGLSNVDTDLLLFLISLIRNYYPMILNAVLVYELPWILDFVLKLVNSWLPQDQRGLIDPITKKELNDNVASDQLPDFLGGTCDLPYKIVPKDAPSAHHLAQQLSISKSAADKLTKHLKPYIMSSDLTIK